MLQRYIIFFLASLSYTFVLSQEQINENGSTSNVLYRNDVSGKAYANTRGYGVMFRQGKHLTALSRSYYEIDLQSLRHPKEAKTQGDGQSRSNYVFGKLNSIFLIRGGVGLQKVLFQKADLKAVEVRYSYSIGPTLALLKPYYVQIYKNGSFRKSIKFDSEDYSHDQVIGRAPFSEGLAETSFFPGLTGKFNLSFEYAPYTNIIRAIETGISIDAFPKALPIMARNPSENIIITFHVGFVFGRKWF
jgi:hypothetical protein